MYLFSKDISSYFILTSSLLLPYFFLTSSLLLPYFFLMVLRTCYHTLLTLAISSLHTATRARTTLSRNPELSGMDLPFGWLVFDLHVCVCVCVSHEQWVIQS
jgi:hypothetical protein